MLTILAAMAAPAAGAATFGTVVPLRGHISDLALDERRGVLYAADFTGNRIFVISTSDNSIKKTLNVLHQPASIALSPSGTYLVVTHVSNFDDPSARYNGVTVIDLDHTVQRPINMGDETPLTISFGLNNLALIVSNKAFELFDPATANFTVIETAGGVSQVIPIKPGTTPPDIVEASSATSADGAWIFGVTSFGGAGGPDFIVYSYDVVHGLLNPNQWSSTPKMGPRVVSVAQDGSSFMAGWSLFSPRMFMLAEQRDITGDFARGSHAIDSKSATIYGQFPREATSVAPLLVMDSDNLNVRERLNMSQELAGKSVLNSARTVMYSVAAGGVAVLPVGQRNLYPRVQALQEDVLFTSGFCTDQMTSREIDIVDPGGHATDFAIASNTPGVMVSPAIGTTPAKVTVTIDPTVFQNQKGTAVATLTLSSAAAVNVPNPVRVLVNNHDPDQRGTILNIPGKLVEILPDPVRDRFYVLRQDTNRVLVYNAANYQQIGILRTGNTPTHMALTMDNKRMLVGNDDSQIVNVFNLDTLVAEAPILMPGGHYPRSIAATWRAILVACRVSGPVHTIDKVDLSTRLGTQLPTLGVWKNDIQVETVLAPTPSGQYIMGADPTGKLWLYDGNSDTFVISRSGLTDPKGAYGAASDDRFVVSKYLLDSSLMPLGQLDTQSGTAAGFGPIVGDAKNAFLTTAVDSASPGVAQRLGVTLGNQVTPTRMIEAPLLPPYGIPQMAFARTLAPLAGRQAIISLSTSGAVILPWNYDAATAIPTITGVYNAADHSPNVASGSIIQVQGANLSLTNQATAQIPLPTAMANSCLTVNGTAIPLFLVTPTQINAQIPPTIAGSATMILHSPAGVSNSFGFEVQGAAPGVFRATYSGLKQPVPTIIRQTNGLPVTLANPIHPKDTISILATGLGVTTPLVEAGVGAPSAPLAVVSVHPVVTLGGTALTVGFAGLIPGQVGLYQIDAWVPTSVPTGMSVPLTIQQGGATTTFDVRVVH